MVASIGLAIGIIDAQAYLIGVMAVSLTTIMALPILKLLFGPSKLSGKQRGTGGAAYASSQFI